MTIGPRPSEQMPSGIVLAVVGRVFDPADSSDADDRLQARKERNRLFGVNPRRVQEQPRRRLVA